MSIALISDIHGNDVALDAVLKEVKGAGIEELFIMGDFLGYYYGHKKVFELLREFLWEGVAGNHDLQWKEFVAGNKEAMAKYRKALGSSLDVALRTLSAEEKQLLLALPITKEINRGGKKILLCHGAPWDTSFYIYPDAPEEILERLASYPYDYVIMGHTHYPMLKRREGVTIINPGSVGQPRDEGSNASWAIVNFESGKVEFRRTRFRPEKIIDEVDQQDPDYPYLKEVLLRKQKS